MSNMLEGYAACFRLGDGYNSLINNMIGIMMSILKKNTKLKKYITAIFVIASIFLLNTAFAEQSSRSPQPSDWNVLVTPYGWIFGMKGDLTARNNVVELDTQPADVLRNLDKIDFIGELHIELQKGRWGLMLDPTYLKLSTDVNFGPFGANLAPHMTIVDFGVYYSLLQHATVNNAPIPITFQLFGGGRHFHMGVDLKPRRFPAVSGSAAFTAPIVGARLIIPVDPNFTFVLRGDYGGFGIDNARSTWSAVILGKVHLYNCMFLSVGYRMLGVDYLETKRVRGKERQSGMDATLFGPVIGINFKF